MLTEQNTSSFTELSQWLAWLEQAHPIEQIELGLSRIKSVAKLLELDKPNSKVITVAGTNGKGSVVATLESLAHQHQLKIASYTSPHLLKFNERIRIDGKPVEDKLIVNAFAHIEAVRAEAKIKLTYFEYTTLVALQIFKQFDLDLCVLEVGLGGRLDAVNIVDCDLAIITSISLDHTDWLGNDLQSIAREKGGVMRAHKPVILADSSLKPLFDQQISELGAIAIIEGRDYFYQDSCDLEKTNSWSFKNNLYKLEGLADSNLYRANLAAALTGFSELFPEQVANSKPELIAQAMANIINIGRFQILNQSPKVILDVAHNPQSARLLNQKLSQHPPKNKLWAICGMLIDKDIKASLSELNCVDKWLCLDLEGTRGALAVEISANLSKEASHTSQNFAKIEAAVSYFKQHQQAGDQLIVFGSFLTASAMLELCQQEGFTWTTN